MNLKESFRYQNYLDRLMTSASTSLTTRDHCVKTVKKHLKSNANPDAADNEEVVVREEFFNNDDVIGFMLWLIDERKRLTEAINDAKDKIDFDLDATIEANKFRQSVGNSIGLMLKYIPVTRVTSATDYKFNVEGNQMPYVYNVEIVESDDYDRVAAKKTLRDIRIAADKNSAEVESAMVNTVVDYEPRFDVNDSFEDVMANFISEAAEA